MDVMWFIMLLDIRNLRDNTQPKTKERNEPIPHSQSDLKKVRDRYKEYKEKNYEKINR